MDFDCSVSAVVGPNGCGKSNIVDAIRWVMGEQSAKSLRGDRMQDILFAGSDTRKPASLAEVSLTFSEIDGELFTPYSELNLTRRLYRDGESEYLINKQPARLKDIQALFVGSGIGKDAFSIFEQGKLDQIIHLTPLERRAIFDEAAGTSRFLLRKKEAMRKMGQVVENYTRVSDLHAEIAKQTHHLKKQAQLAISVKDNSARLAFLDKQVLLSQWRGFFEKTAELRAKIEGQEQSMALMGQEILAQEELANRAREALSASELAQKLRQKELAREETAQRVLESEIGQEKKRLFESRKRMDAMQSESRQLAGQIDALRREITEKESLVSSLSLTSDLKETIKHDRTAHLAKIQEEGKLSAQLKECSVRLETQLARAKVIDELESDCQKKEQEVAATLRSQEEKVAELAGQIDSLKEELVQAEEQQRQRRASHAELEAQEKKALRSITEAESHEKSLLKLKEAMEGFSQGAKLLLKEAKNAQSPLFQKVEPLVDYFTPRKGYEGVVALAMKRYEPTLVVQTDNDFEELLSFARQKKIADFSVVIVSRLKADQGEKKDSSLVHVLEDNLVAQALAGAIELDPGGGYYDSLGVFFDAAAGSQSNAFHRASELKALAREIAIQRKDMQDLAQEVTQSAEQTKAVEYKRTELIEKRRKKEMDLVKENFLLQQAKQELVKLVQQQERFKKEREGFGDPHDKQEEIEQLKKQIATRKEEIVRLGAQLQSKENMQEKWEALDRALQILHTKHKTSLAQEKRVQEELKELSASEEKSIGLIADKEKEILCVRAKCAEVAHEVKKEELQSAEMKKTHSAYEKELVHKRKSLASLDKTKHGYEISYSQDFGQQQRLEQEIADKYGIKEGALLDEPCMAKGQVDEALKEMQRLRAAIDSAGMVNMAAIEELKEVQQRFDFFDGQLKDLEGSKKDLEEITVKLDLESRKIFKQTFMQIKENFQKNFAILFNGGSADLSFTEQSDILEAGIEIMAKPPGKQMRAISLLSGGEKCLTALALLFSIFEVKRAPFCLLDEVDAPLDDSNVERFAQMVQQFTDKTQFIVVTHNKKTMVMAERLIGVSMEEKGVSKLISLTFEKRQEGALAT